MALYSKLSSFCSRDRRTRWTIAAVTLVLLSGVGVASAEGSSDSEQLVFVGMNPCRLFDTRPDWRVGPRGTPLGEEEEYTVVGRGKAGDCAIPTDAEALLLNATAVGATKPTYLTLFPADASRPTASNLNPWPGTPPAPNAVTVALSSDGAFKVYNRFGSVDVLGDVNGYFAKMPASAATTDQRCVMLTGHGEPSASLNPLPCNGYLDLASGTAWQFVDGSWTGPNPLGTVGPKGDKGDTGAKGAKGDRGADGSPGADDNSAYAVINADGTIHGTPHNIVGVTHPNSWIYCVELAPDLSAQSAVPVATPMRYFESELFFTVAYPAGLHPTASCGAGEIYVYTYRRRKNMFTSEWENVSAAVPFAIAIHNG